MSKIELPRDQWVEYFEAFTTTHQGQPSSIGIDGRQPTPELIEVAVRQVPLREVAVDLKDHESTIVISLGLSEDRLLRHAIQAVSRVSVTSDTSGEDAAIEIETTNGQTTTLHLGVPVLPKR